MVPATSGAEVMLGSGVIEAGLGSGEEEQRLWRASLLEVEEGRDTEAALVTGGHPGLGPLARGWGRKRRV